MIQNKNEFSTEDDSDMIESKNNILNKNENPEIIIEKVLIFIYNQNINQEKSKKEELDKELCQNQIKKLCLKYEEYYIVLLLLKSIRKLINKYKEILFEIPCISKILKEKKYLEYPERSNSQNNKTYKISQNIVRFKSEYNNITNRSNPKYKGHYSALKTLFSELYNIKNCLKNSGPIIEKVFEIPLSQFEKFSIKECEKEDYLKILIRNKFISNEIKKNKNSEINKIIEEITKGNYSNVKMMTEKIKLFNKIHQSRKNFHKILEIGSSVDEKYPEDAQPIEELRYNHFNNFINLEDNNSNSNYCLSTEGDGNKMDFDIIEEQSITDNNLANFNIMNFENNINNLEEEDEEKDDINENENDINNEIFNAIKERNNIDNQTKSIKQAMTKINKVNQINTININDNDKILDMPNLFTKNNNKENIEKKFSFNSKKYKQNNTSNIISQNKNNIRNYKPKKEYANILKNERIIRDKEQFLFKNITNLNIKNKKENNGNKIENTNKNIKIEKKEIPSDIDDLVKYIVNDDKKDTQNKRKKKKKKKTKKKNKNEIEENKEEENLIIEEKKEKEMYNEINEVKKNLFENSINRFKIHKIKFKYNPKWLEKISKET